MLLLAIKEYYGYGDSSRLDQKLIDEVNYLSDQAEANADNFYHPAYQLWLERYNMLSATEADIAKTPRLGAIA